MKTLAELDARRLETLRTARALAAMRLYRAKCRKVRRDNPHLGWPLGAT